MRQLFLGLIALSYFLSVVAAAQRYGSIHWDQEIQKIWKRFEPKLQYRLLKYQAGEIGQPLGISETSLIVEEIDRAVEIFVKDHLQEALKDYVNVDKALRRILRQCRGYMGKYDPRYNDPLPRSLSRKPLQPELALVHLGLRYLLTALRYSD